MCSAYKEYQSHMLAGEDGRPDWFARKACNYLTATVEVKKIVNQIFKLLVIFNDRTAMAS